MIHQEWNTGPMPLPLHHCQNCSCGAHQPKKWFVIGNMDYAWQLALAPYLVLIKAERRCYHLYQVIQLEGLWISAAHKNRACPQHSLRSTPSSHDFLELLNRASQPRCLPLVWARTSNISIYQSAKGKWESYECTGFVTNEQIPQLFIHQCRMRSWHRVHTHTTYIAGKPLQVCSWKPWEIFHNHLMFPVTL